MAEAILKHLVVNRPDAKSWYINSAGTWAHHGVPPTLLSQLVVQSMGEDISNHLSQPVSTQLIKQSDLVLTMERQHKEGLTLQFPEYAGRIYMLSEMVGRVEDVPDPVLGELIDYQATARLLERFLSGGLEKIYQLASRHPSNQS
jgi:protein-tyrosine-phosphatase